MIYPSVQLIAKSYQKVYDELKKQFLHNFAEYHGLKYLQALHDVAPDEFSATDKELSIILPDGGPHIDEDIYEYLKFSDEILNPDFQEVMYVRGHMRFISFQVSGLHHYGSKRTDYPYEIIDISFNHTHEVLTKEGNYRDQDIERIKILTNAIPDPLYQLINFSSLSQEQEESIILAPYWLEPEKIETQGFSYHKFKEMDNEELAVAVISEFNKLPQSEVEEYLKQQKDWMDFMYG